MSRKNIALIMLIPFLGLTLYALLDVGYIGILDYHRHSSAGWQVFTDLVIALVLVLSFLIPHARANGRNPWPWVIGTLFTGSIAPLLYLVTAKNK
ncbi:MAG: hypothetical protein GJ680_20210 [Alteromonadaceae bacterium]|nr:hypothetical protein [Alteromonadaceae bacterium]